MNTSQITNIVLKFLVFFAGIAAAHGLGKYVAFLNDQESLGFITLGITWLVSHIMHKDPPANGSTPSAGTISRGGALTAFLLLCGLSCFLSVGCATGRLSQVADISVTTAMYAWRDYVKAKHPGPVAEAKVKAAFEKVKAAELTVIDAEIIYATSGTNAAAGDIVTARRQAEADALTDALQVMRQFGLKI